MEQLMLDGFRTIKVTMAADGQRAIIIIDNMSLDEFGALRSQLMVAVAASVRDDALLEVEYIETERCDGCS